MPDNPGVDQLGFYTLAGHVDDPREMLAELQLAEELGLGNAFISERLNVKEACSLSGAAGASTRRIDVTTGATTSTLGIRRSRLPSRPRCTGSPAGVSFSGSGGVFGLRSPGWGCPRPPRLSWRTSPI